MKKFTFVIPSLLMGLMVSCTNSDSPSTEAESEGLPNIVVIYCDDLGYGDLGCFGNEVVEFRPDQHFTTKTYTEKALDFIERHANQPFYLYLAHSMPHVPIYASPEFEGRSGHGIYTDVIEEIDWSVGEVLKKLKEHGVLNNTLVVFSSDNGPWLAMRELGGTAGMLREGKQWPHMIPFCST